MGETISNKTPINYILLVRILPSPSPPEIRGDFKYFLTWILWKIEGERMWGKVNNDDNNKFKVNVIRYQQKEVAKTTNKSATRKKKRRSQF